MKALLLAATSSLALTGFAFAQTATTTTTTDTDTPVENAAESAAEGVGDAAQATGDVMEDAADGAEDALDSAGDTVDESVTTSPEDAAEDAADAAEGAADRAEGAADAAVTAGTDDAEAETTTDTTVTTTDGAAPAADATTTTTTDVTTDTTTTEADGAADMTTTTDTTTTDTETTTTVVPTDGSASVVGDAEQRADVAAAPVEAPDVDAPVLSADNPGMLGSAIMNRRIFTTNQPSTTEWASTADLTERPAEWTDIAKVDDLVFDASGNLVGYIADIGGFLGIGAKQVLLGKNALNLVRINDDMFYATNYTREELEALPDFDTTTVIR